MATYALHHRNYEHALLWTLTLSISLHLLAVLVLPSIKIAKEPPEPTLTIELAPAKKIEPPPVELPKPETTPQVKPEPVPVKPIKQPDPVIKNNEVKTKPNPSPIAEPPPATSPVAEPAAPPVIAVAPKAEVAPAPAAPPPEPVKAGPSQQDVDAAKNQYGNLLARELAKHKQYPKIAQMRGWEGEVVLELQLDSNGNVISSKIHESSTFDALDKQALEMVKKANFPPPPEALRGRSFNILVPVSFKLE